MIILRRFEEIRCDSVLEILVENDNDKNKIHLMLSRKWRAIVLIASLWRSFTGRSLLWQSMKDQQV